MADETNPEIPRVKVDCLVYNSVLSEVPDPGKLLEEGISWLEEEGQILAVFGNGQYWQQIVRLIQGRSQEAGASLAQLQQQAFSVNRIKEIFATAGLQIYEIQTVADKSKQLKLQLQKFLRLMAGAIEALGIDRATFATQTSAREYIVRATKSPVAPRRLLIQTNLMGSWPVYRIRTIEPDRFSRTIPGVRTVATVKSADLSIALPQEEKVFIWQRSMLQYPADIPKLKRLLEKGYLIVAETDDDPLWRPEYERGKFLNFRGCHCVQTSTEPLADYLRQHNPNVAVFPNQIAYLPPSRFSPLAYSEDSEVKNSDFKNTVTLFFGAFRREEDWQPIMTALNRVLKDSGKAGRFSSGALPEVRVRVVYDKQFFDALETEAKEFEPLCDRERYLKILSSCDIALLPLNPTRFNGMKSDLKFLESAACGAAVLASPTVYEDSIIEGKTGLIYRSVKDFEAKLRELIGDRQLRQSIATNAWQWVVQNRLLSQHYRKRRDWYLQMLDELPRLNRELRDRLPEL